MRQEVLLSVLDDQQRLGPVLCSAVYGGGRPVAEHGPGVFLLPLVAQQGPAGLPEGPGIHRVVIQGRQMLLADGEGHPSRHSRRRDVERAAGRGADCEDGVDHTLHFGVEPGRVVYLPEGGMKGPGLPDPVIPDPGLLKSLEPHLIEMCCALHCTVLYFTVLMYYSTESVPRREEGSTGKYQYEHEVMGVAKGAARGNSRDRMLVFSCAP